MTTPEPEKQPGLFSGDQPVPLQEAALIGGFVGDRELEVSEKVIDRAEDLVDLEKSYTALKFIINEYRQPELTELERALAPLNQPMHAVTHIGNQFAAKIVPCFMEPDVETALIQLREITPHTTDEELVLLASDEQVASIHTKLHGHLGENNDAIVRAASERLEKSTSSTNPNVGRIAGNDRYQFNGNETARSLENMRTHGIRVAVNKSGEEVLRTANQQVDDGVLPLVELVKNEPILVVNGFDDSKISLAIHDTMDHFWTFDLAEKVGLFDKFQDLFNSIGSPQGTDIFKREGEVVASIAFGVRYWATMEHGFKPLVDIHELIRRMDVQFDAGELTDRHMAAYRILRGLAHQPSSREAQSLGFVFSNYVTELDEQRRKHGKIKQRDLRTNRVIGELDPNSPDYMSFFIELHHELLSSKHKHRDDLLRMHILLEEYFIAVAQGAVDAKDHLRIDVRTLRDIDFSTTTLPPSRINWMARNYGFTAVRDAII